MYHLESIRDTYTIILKPARFLDNGYVSGKKPKSRRLR